MLPSEICFSQNFVIKGKVIDQPERKPVPFANVYFNNSLTGTTTDTDGNFILHPGGGGIYILIVSFVGYESFRKTVRLSGNDTLTINVILNPVLKELAGVEVIGKVDKRWKRQFRKFKYNFFGPNVSSKYCEILNPGYLDFYENPETDSFTARSNVPLEIINHRLGYKIYFKLKEFCMYKGRLSIYYGEVRFEELVAKTSGELASWEVNRYNTYRGSLRNFFRDLMNNTLEKDGFLVYRVRPSAALLNYNSFYHKLDNELVPIDRKSMILMTGNPNIRYFVSVSPIEIIYTGRYSARSPYPDMPYEVSRVIQNKNHVELNTNGFVYDPAAFTVTGVRAGERAADMLPFEYAPPDKAGEGSTENLNELYFQLTDSLARTVDGQGKLWGQEDVYFGTDKPYYIAGDEIWYNARLADNFSRQNEAGERILYVDLVSPDDSVIIHQTLPSVDGFSSGHILLPEYLAEGCYLLRGYTDWMRNFGDASYTGRMIAIHSDSRRSAAASPVIPAGDTVIMHFYPEGGSLLKSMESKMAFRATDRHGYGIMVSGVLTDERNREIEKIESGERGIGIIRFKPGKDTKYFVRIGSVNRKRTNLVYPVPEIKESGYTMSVIRTDQGDLSVHIEATSDNKDHGLVLIAQSGGRIFYQEAFFLEGTRKLIGLPGSQFPEGVVQLNLFDFDGRLTGQRLVYNDYSTEKPEITIIAEKPEYNPEEQVTLRIHMESRDQIPVGAGLSVSVTANDLFDWSALANPAAGMILESAFFEGIQDPALYFRDTTAATREERDNLMLTMTRYRYDWRMIPGSPQWPYEKTRMLHIRGKVLDPKRPCAGCEVNLFPVGRGISFLNFTADGDGNFSSAVPGLFDSATYIAQIVNKRGRVIDGKLKLEDDTPYKIGNACRNCMTLRADINEADYNRMLHEISTENEQLRTVLLKEVAISGKRAGEPPEMKKMSETGIYGTADEVIDLNDGQGHYYSITDVLAKYISGFSITPDGPGYYKFILHGPHSFNQGAQDPLFIVDGVELDSRAYEVLKTITPGQVEKIEVFKNASAAIWGARGANGVFVIYTKQGENNSSRHREVLNINGFSPEITFQPPGKDTTDLAVDRRITIYWAGNLSTDSYGNLEIHFKNVSNAGFFTVHVEGVTADGVPFSYADRTDH